MTEIVLADLTQTTLDGEGVFDVLMRANRAHLEAEFKQNRIKGPEYATVYLGSLESVMRTSMEFLLQRKRIGLEAQLLEKQIILAQVAVTKAEAELAILNAGLAKIPLELLQMTAQTDMVNQQIANTVDELATAILHRAHMVEETKNVVAQNLQLVAQTAQVTTQTELAAQQTNNMVLEGLNIPKQGEMLDAQISHTLKQVSIADAEISIKGQQVLVSQAEVGIAQAKLTNIPKEGLHMDAQTAMVTQQKESLTLQALNIPKEGLVLDTQVCKGKAEYTAITTQTARTEIESTLLTQKIATEKAQVTALGVDDNSVLGKQKLLYAAQTEGFTRDAEQKVAKLMVDTWNVRRTTAVDDGEISDTNMLTDGHIGLAVTKMLSGVKVWG